jgi:hypothetical protein
MVTAPSSVERLSPIAKGEPFKGGLIQKEFYPPKIVPNQYPELLKQ